MSASSQGVLAVVVLYGVAPSESKTLQGLRSAFAGDPSLRDSITVLVWDNSPEALAADGLPFPCLYQHSTRNTGVSGAYNGAAALAAQRGDGWLLLLDHDTSITAEFLRGALRHARTETSDQVAAIVPFLYAGEFCMSPRQWRAFRHVALERPSQSYEEKARIFAANSGTLIRRTAIESVGGYSSRFWLDFSDIEIFERLHRRGYTVRIAPDLRLEHEMAMLDYDAGMTPSRYATFLAAEDDFMDLYRGPMERGMHLLRLAARVLHQRSYADPAYAAMTRAALWERIRLRRTARLRRRPEETR